MIPNFDKLDPIEQAVAKWQYGMNGDFYGALWEAIMRADERNLRRLGAGFPEEVQGYRLYTREEGWWEAVEAKIGK